jgi:hypothetical protein
LTGGQGYVTKDIKKLSLSLRKNWRFRLKMRLVMSEIDNDIGFKEKRTIFAENGRKLPKIR